MSGALFPKREGNFWQVEISVDEHGPDTDPTVPDTRNRSPWQRWWWHSVKLGLRAADTGCIRYAGQLSHWTTFGVEKKIISLPSLSSNSVPRITLQGLRRGKLITPFDWWCLAHLERFHTGVWFTCTSALEMGPEQSPGPKHLKLFRNSEEDLNFHLCIALYQFLFILRIYSLLLFPAPWGPFLTNCLQSHSGCWSHWSLCKSHKAERASAPRVVHCWGCALRLAELPWTEEQALATDGLSYLQEHSVNEGAKSGLFSGFVTYKVSVSFPYCKTPGDFKCHRVEALCKCRERPGHSLK